MSENNVNQKRDFVPPPPTNYAVPPEDRFAKDPSPYKKSTAILLALFLGVYGVHDFYTGNTKKGIIKVVVLFTIIGSVALPFLAIVDIVKIMNGTYLDGEGRVLQ